MGLISFLIVLTFAGIISAAVDYYAFERLMDEGLYEL
jgi:hypothetical protein